MNNVIKLAVGDASGDRHNFREYIDVKINVSYAELGEAYEKGTKIIGVDLEMEVDDYEENSLSVNFVKVISDYLPIHKYVENAEGGDFTIDANEYSKLWLDVACIGNPSIKYEILNIEVKDIGGYGLISP